MNFESLIPNNANIDRSKSIVTLLLLVVIVIGSILYIRYRPYGNIENFDDNSRSIMSQSPLLIFCNNGWLRASRNFNPVFNINNLIRNVGQFNRNWATETFKFEDVNDGGTIRGSQMPFTNKQVFYIKTIEQNGWTPFYLIYRNKNWELTEDRNLLGNHGMFSMEKINVNDIKQHIEYGDKVRIVHNNSNQYLQFNKTNLNLVPKTTINNTTEFIVLDNHGNMKLKDWARESTVMMSSLYEGNKYPAQNAIDGDINTFAHTAVNDKNPIFDVYLPKDIFITKIVITNRRDCCKERLFPINCQIMKYNSPGNEEFLLTMTYDTKDTSKFDTVVFNPINKLGNKVRLHLTGPNRILNFARIQVFGYGPENTINIVNKIDRIVLQRTVPLRPLVIEREYIPTMNQNMTLLYKIQLNKLINNKNNYVFLQGSDPLSYSFRLSDNVIQMLGFVENDKNIKQYSFNQKLVVKKSIFVGVVVNRGVNEKNGWILNNQNNTNYLVQVGTKNYYIVPKLQNFNEWKNKSVQKNNFDLTMMKYLGEYNTSLYRPSIQLFYNDKFVRRIELPINQPLIIPNYQRLLINRNNHRELDGSIGPIFMSNTIYSQDELNQIKLNWNRNFLENKLILKNASLLNRNVIRGQNIPTINNNMTISFWLKPEFFSKTNEGLKAILQRTFVNNTMTETSHNSPSILYNTQNNSLVLLFDTDKTKNIRFNISSVVFKQKQWYYINVYCINKRNIEIFVNNKLISKHSLPNDLLISNQAPVYIGTNSKYTGMNGFIQNVTYSNTILSMKQRHRMYLQHPDRKMFNYVNTSFKNVGCKQNLVPDIDYNYSGNNWYKIIKNINNHKQNTEMTTKMKSVKTLADKFLNNPSTVNRTEGINAVNMCYGTNSKFVAEKLTKIINQQVPKPNPKPVSKITTLTPKPNVVNNKSLIVLPQILYGKNSHTLFSKNQNITYPKLNNFSVQFWIMPNRTNTNSPKDFMNVFSINNIRVTGNSKQVVKYDLFSIRYNLFTNQLMICFNNGPNNNYQCNVLNQRLNQTVWNNITIQLNVRQLSVQINNQQVETINIQNSVNIADLYEFEFGKVSNRPVQTVNKNLKLNVDGFDGFIKLLTLSNFIINDQQNQRITKFKNNQYNNENIDVEQLIVGAKYADNFKNICPSNISTGLICNIKNQMIPHIQKYWNLWKPNVVKRLGYQEKIKNVNDAKLWTGTYVEYLFNRFDLKKPVQSTSKPNVTVPLKQKFADYYENY